MKLKKKGFTLVELLAVIVILAIILAIAIPSITGIIDKQRRNAFEANVKMIVKGIEFQILDDPGSVETGDNLSKANDFGADASQYDTLTIDDLDPVTITVVAKQGGKFTGYQTTGATYNNVTVTTVDYD